MQLIIEGEPATVSFRTNHATITYSIPAKKGRTQRVACGYGNTQQEAVDDAIGKIRELGRKVEVRE
jgi:hypothetical protein